MCAALTALRTHPADLGVQCAACGVVKTLLLDVPELALAAAEAGAMELIAHALCVFSGADMVAIDACFALGVLACRAFAHRHLVLLTSAIGSVITVMKTRPRSAVAQKVGAYALCCLCTDEPDACAQAASHGAVAVLCAAVRALTDEDEALQSVLEALRVLVLISASAAADAAAAGPAWIPVLAWVLLSSTLEKDGTILMSGCSLLARVADCVTDAVSSADVVMPVLHVLQLVCSQSSSQTKRVQVLNACHSCVPST